MESKEISRIFTNSSRFYSLNNNCARTIDGKVVGLVESRKNLLMVSYSDGASCMTTVENFGPY